MTTCKFFSGVYLQYFSIEPEQTHGAIRGRTGSERSLPLPNVWWHCINTLIIPCVEHEPATGQNTAIIFYNASQPGASVTSRLGPTLEGLAATLENREQSSCQGVLPKPSFPVCVLEFKGLCYWFCDLKLAGMASQKHINSSRTSTKPQEGKAKAFSFFPLLSHHFTHKQSLWHTRTCTHQHSHIHNNNNYFLKSFIYTCLSLLWHRV